MSPSPEQAAAIASQAPRLLLSAGAGSGKSTVLLHRIAATIQRGASPAKMIAITFTTAGARVLTERLAALGLPTLRHVGTLHSLCLAEAHKWATWGKRRPQIVDEEVQTAMIKAELKRLRLDKKASILDVASTLAAGQASSPRIYASNPAYPAAVAVRRQMLAQGVASMDLLLGEATVHLWNCLEPKWDMDTHVLDALFWDEFQDTSAGDFAILHNFDATTGQMTLVGDSLQAIYGFRGASPDYFRALADDTRWEKLTLRDNYRSRWPIIESANRLTAGQPGAIAMQAMRPEVGLPPIITQCATEAEEIAFIRSWLEFRDHGTRAILCRHNALAARLRQALADMLPASPAVELDPQILRDTMEQIQRTVVDIRKFHHCLPYVRHFTDLCGTDSPEVLLPAMAEALAQAEQRAAYDYGGLYIGTAHGSKGAEYDHVLVAGVEEASWLSTPEMIRLFYVACTRARDSLTITSAARRPSLFGKGWTESGMAGLVGKL